MAPYSVSGLLGCGIHSIEEPISKMPNACSTVHPEPSYLCTEAMNVGFVERIRAEDG
jgi:hypothetical protein